MILLQTEIGLILTFVNWKHITRAFHYRCFASNFELVKTRKYDLSNCAVPQGDSPTQMVLLTLDDMLKLNTLKLS